ncbi:hypothetical protein [Vibrio sp. 10N.261.51.F12]|uniref:hypothetical protein n=1 Tax=Vibrio sp. 10N.261.51.F12 TaxID=3229679 RepID=UPI0035509C6D
MNQQQFDEINSLRPFPTQAELEASVNQLGDRAEVSALYEQIMSDLHSHSYYDCDSCDNHISPNESRKRIKLKILSRVPQLALFLKNIHPGAAHQVEALSVLRDEKVDFGNISDFKRDLRTRHEERWTRDLREVSRNNETQGGVSVLGSVSEELLKRAIRTVSQSEDIFQTNQDDTKSYGDFVLMSLPNNLWFSVKSGFSRERLLASGFSNDLVGVGFFEEPAEFISQHKVRNFKKAGFLAIYLPDVAVTERQHNRDTSTYREVMSFYGRVGNVAPLNINGTEFFRPLSRLGDDIRKLLDVELQRRSTLKF